MIGLCQSSRFFLGSPVAVVVGHANVDVHGSGLRAPVINMALLGGLLLMAFRGLATGGPFVGRFALLGGSSRRCVLLLG